MVGYADQARSKGASISIMAFERDAPKAARPQLYVGQFINEDRMLKIAKSVGQSGVNASADVKTIQQLVNRNLHITGSVKPLNEDGIAGHQTIAAIREFQRTGLQMQMPDGLVSPGGPTFSGLVKTTRSARPANVSAFLTKVLPSARKVKATYKVPIAVLIAQAALESGWGQRVKDNAYLASRENPQRAEPLHSRHVGSSAGRKSSQRMLFVLTQIFRKQQRITECF